MMENCAWIGAEHPHPEGKFAYFRLDADLPRDKSLTMNITAAARYRLFINGQAVCTGPCAGDQHVWYADTVDVTPYLREGKNAFAVQVLCLDPVGAVEQGSMNASLFRIMVPDHRHRLAVSAQAGDVNLSTGTANWRVWADDCISLHTEHPIIEFLGDYFEHVDLHGSPASWKTDDCSQWPKAVFLETMEPTPVNSAVGVCKRYPVQPRPIPLRFRREEGFVGEIKTQTGILSAGKAEIPAHSVFEAILDAGQVKVTEPVFRAAGGDGARLEITYFEKFGRPEQELRRDDWQHGEIDGITDTVLLNDEEIRYEPFYARTFRFVRLRLTTEDAAAVLYAPIFFRTGYPLREDSEISSTTPWVKQLWRMSVETLQNCMLDTYMDCPYYEQLQYIMDTRLQVLFHFAVSQDTAMQRKALEDFHRSILPCGLLPGKYPTAYLQVISTFSLHYIFMIWEYYWQTGDASVLYKYRADCDRILSYYAEHLSDRQLMNSPGFWPFVDWLPAWGKTAGTPEALQHGESTIISLMYAYALDIAAHIYETSGRPGMAEEYRNRKQAVCEAVRTHCWDDQRGMFREGPSFAQFTQHAQAWAVLCGVGGRECVLHALQDEDVLRVRFATAYEWFRALEKTGLYDYARQELQPWIDLIALDCKTCPETPTNARSENHAWSALPMLELLRGAAGIQPQEPGWKTVSITPHLLDLPALQGTAATPIGKINFSFTPEKYEITLPEGMKGSFRHPNGSTVPLHEGTQVIF